MAQKKVKPKTKKQADEDYEYLRRLFMSQWQVADFKLP